MEARTRLFTKGTKYLKHMTPLENIVFYNRFWGLNNAAFT